MLKIAIISDIHGNLPALEAVLVDIEQNYQADKIYCLGDLVDAVPWHNEVIELIRQLNIPTVMGNHDERIVLNSKVIAMPKHTEEETNARISAISFTKKTTTPENKIFLSTFPENIRLEHAGTRCLLVHGSPKSNKQYIFEDRPEEEVAGWFAENNTDIILMGHTHYSYIHPIATDEGNKLLINVGSVGRCKEKIGAKAVYLWITIDDEGKVAPTLRKIDYDVHRTIAAIKASPIPDFYAEFFEKHLKD